MKKYIIIALLICLSLLVACSVSDQGGESSPTSTPSGAEFPSNDPEINESSSSAASSETSEIEASTPSTPEESEESDPVETEATEDSTYTEPEETPEEIPAETPAEEKGKGRRKVAAAKA